VEKEAAIALSDEKQAKRMKTARLKERNIMLQTLPDTFFTLERKIAAAQAHARYVSDNDWIAVRVFDIKSRYSSIHLATKPRTRRKRKIA
jgi:hypothetical protein